MKTKILFLVLFISANNKCADDFTGEPMEYQTTALIKSSSTIPIQEQKFIEIKE